MRVCVPASCRRGGAKPPLASRPGCARPGRWSPASRGSASAGPPSKARAASSSRDRRERDILLRGELLDLLPSAARYSPAYLAAISTCFANGCVPMPFFADERHHRRDSSRPADAANQIASAHAQAAVRGFPRHARAGIARGCAQMSRKREVSRSMASRLREKAAQRASSTKPSFRPIRREAQVRVVLAELEPVLRPAREHPVRAPTPRE
jgi:hypothetical protein